MPVIRYYRNLPPEQKFSLSRRIWRSIFGFTVLGIGIALLVLPGPAIVVIPVGLAILATEYTWARRYLMKFKQGGEKLGRILLPAWFPGKGRTKTPLGRRKPHAKALKN